MDNNNSVDMSNFMNNLNGMLENENIKNLLNNIKNNNSSTSSDGASNENDSASSNINPEMINNIMNMFNNSNNENNSSGFNNSTSSDSANNTPNFDMEMFLKMKSIMDKMNSNKNDPRSNLLLSLKPYLKDSRKNKVEQYIQLFNMSKVMEVFNPNGGEKLK